MKIAIPLSLMLLLLISGCGGNKQSTDNLIRVESTKEALNLAKGITPINKEIAFIQKLDAADLVEAYEKGQLKGPLKQIAAELNEESNPVIMVAKNRRD